MNKRTRRILTWGLVVAGWMGGIAAVEAAPVNNATATGATGSGSPSNKP